LGDKWAALRPGLGQTAGVLLTLTSTTPPATDLGYLLHKHPARVQSFELPVGRATVFYPERAENRATVALLLEVDPIDLVRGRKIGGGEGFSLGQYVNDRPYAASSMLAVALGRVFNTAMSGRCDLRPEVAASPLRLEVHLPVLPCRGGPDLAQEMFGPLGWTVTATPIPADPEIPQWGDSPYVDLRLTGVLRVADALHHLYVLLPVLDDAKHYWVGMDEVDKLVRASAGWLRTHPERELISRRYLAHRRDLVSSVVGRLAEIDDANGESFDNAVPDDTTGESFDNAAPRSLAAQRRAAVLGRLRAVTAASVIDLGCGEGALLAELLKDPAFTRILGADVSDRALRSATRRLRLDSLPDRQRARIELVQSSLAYRDDRLAGFDAMVLMEVIEHVDPPRLSVLARNVFGHAQPGTVLVTTPNSEYNVRYPDLPPGRMRHPDHRFEWTREQFRRWAESISAEYGYSVRYLPVGPVDEAVGPPTQLAEFNRPADGNAKQGPQ